VLISEYCRRLLVFRSRNGLGGIGALLLLCVGSASAQEASRFPQSSRDRYSFAVSRVSWSSEARSSGLAELTFVDALRRHGKVDQYKETPAAGLKLYHYTAGLRFELPVMEHSRWDLIADVGMGATRLRSAEFANYYVSEQRVSETFLSLLGGVSVQYAVSDECRLFVGARQLFYLEDGDGLVIDGLKDPDQVLESGSWTVPLTLGVRFSFR
jgi:hypothetical protein